MYSSRRNPSSCACQSLGTWRYHRATRQLRTNPCGCLRHMLSCAHSPLKTWLRRSMVISLGTWPSKPTNSELLSIKAESLSIHCTMLTSVTAASSTTTMSSSTSWCSQTSTPRNRRVQNCDCPWQSAWVETDQEMARRLALSCLSWSTCPRYRCCCCCLALSLLWLAHPELHVIFWLQFSWASLYPMGVACFLMSWLLSAFVPMSARLPSLLTRRNLKLFDLTSSCNQKCATSMCFIVKPKSHIMLWTPFALTLPILLRTVLLLRCIWRWSSVSCICFQQMSSHERDSRDWRFHHFFVSSPIWVRENCHFRARVPEFENLDPVCLSPFKYRTNLFNMEKLCCEGSVIFWHNSITANVMSALSSLKNKHLTTWDLYLLSCSESNHTGFSSIMSSITGICTLYPFPTTDSQRERQSVEDRVGTISYLTPARSPAASWAPADSPSVKPEVFLLLWSKFLERRTSS